ncbi:MAG: hypothetical protein RLZZ500_1704 [Bacteroidota bacterium]|jgi:gliding motility-associated-like protein
MPTKIKNTLLLIGLFLSFLSAQGQLTNFTFTVTPTAETCTGNGSLAFTVTNTTAGATFTYAIYQLPNTTTPIAITSLPSYGGLSAGNYQVIATQTLGPLSNTQFANVQITDLTTVVTFQILGQQVNCVNANVTVQVTSGTAVSYEIIAGPQLFPPQSSNYFPNLGPGTYTIRVNDACGEGVAQSYTVSYQNPPNLAIGSFTPTCELISCDRISGELFINSTLLNSPIRYPLTVQAVANPPGGGAPVTYSQVISSGGLLNSTLNVQVPFYHGQSYTYSFIVTDACGNVYNSAPSTLNQAFTVNVSTSTVGCFRNLSLTACTFKFPLQVQFLSAPAGFNPVLFNPNHPGPFNTATINYSSSTSNTLPLGNYSIKITDACGRTSTITTTVLPAEPGFLLSPSSQECASVYNYMMPLGNGTQVAQVIVENAPPTYTTTLPLNVSSQINSGSIQLTLPTGNYTISGFDVCGLPFSYSFFVPPLNPNVTTEALNLVGCANSGSGTIRFLAQGTRLQSIILTSTTANFTQPLPYDFSSNIQQPNAIAALLLNLPFGIYTFTVTDTCGNTYQKIIILNKEVNTGPNNLLQLSGCDIGFGSFKMTSPNGAISSASITAAPPAFSSNLPFNLNTYIDTSGRLFVPNLPEGLYTIHTIDACGVERNEDVALVGFHFQEQIQVIPACNSYSLDVVYSDNNSSIHTFWLQKWNPLAGVWEHPITGFDYITGTIPNILSSYSLSLGINNNIGSEGHFRVLSVFESYNQANNTNLQCIQSVKEFDFSDVVSIDAAYLINCPNAGTQVIIDANGIPPLQYSITTLNGSPYLVNNGTNSVFIGLAPGLYNFTVEDNCGNIVNRDFDIGLLTPPTITGQNFCDGQVGQLSIDLVNSYSYQWWNAANPSVILSTSNVLTFTPFSNSTSPGTYVVQLHSSLNSSCADQQFTYVIPSNPAPNAGGDGLLESCEQITQIDLYTVLQGNYASGGVWSSTSVSSGLSGSIWDTTNVSYGTYVFNYRVDGLCGAFDESQVTIVLKEPLPNLNLTGTITACSGTSIQLGAPFIANAAYSWVGPNGFSSSIQEPLFPAVTSTDAGVYTLTVTRNGCQKTGVIDVVVNPLPEFTIEQECYGGRYKMEVIPLNNSFDPTSVAYSWTGPFNFIANENPIYLLQEPAGSYEVTVVNDLGCSTQIPFQVNETMCAIPNVITPNQDGANDSFDLLGFDVKLLEIYNRWGRKVYEKSAYINEWEGQNQQGESLPDGVYFYHLELPNDQHKQGWILVVF